MRDAAAAASPSLPPQNMSLHFERVRRLGKHPLWVKSGLKLENCSKEGALSFVSRI